MKALAGNHARIALPQKANTMTRRLLFYGDAPDMQLRFKDGSLLFSSLRRLHAPMIGEGLIKKLVFKVKI